MRKTRCERLAVKLYDEIQKSKSSKLVDIMAFSIPFYWSVGFSKIMQYDISIEDIGEKSCTEAGIGQRITTTYLNG